MVPESAPARTAPSPVPTSHKAAGMAPVAVTSSVSPTPKLSQRRVTLSRAVSVPGGRGSDRPPSHAHGQGHTVSRPGSA